MKPRQRNSLLLLVLVLIGIGVILVLFSLFKTQDILSVYKLDVQFIVEDSMVLGFDVNNTILSFGKVPRGLSGMRVISIANRYGFPVRVELVPLGEIVPFISFSENHFVLESGKSADITVFVTPGSDAPYKTYHGELLIFFRR